MNTAGCARFRGQRVRWNRGKLSTTDGPFTEAKEVIGGYAILEAPSMEAALELTKRFLHVHGNEWNVECELRPLDGWEFGCADVAGRLLSATV